MMSRDMNLLQQYDPASSEKKSLPELQEDARTSTVDIGKNQFDKISGQLSERIPMTIQDAKGKKIEGFFTKGKKFSVRPQFDKVVDDALKMDGDKEFLKDFLKKYRAARVKKDPKFAEYTDEYLIARSRNMRFRDENGNIVEGTFMDVADGTDLSKKMKEKGVTDLKDLVGKNDYEKDRIEYAKKLKAYTNKHKVEALTDHQREILKQHDESDVMDLNKKMKEEVIKLQKQKEGPDNGPQAGL